MGAFGSIDIPARGIDYFRATLQDREAALVNAKRRRDVILNALARQTSASTVASSAHGLNWVV